MAGGDWPGKDERTMAVDTEGKVCVRLFTGPCWAGQLTHRARMWGCPAFAGTEYIYVLADSESDARIAAGCLMPFRGDRVHYVVGPNLTRELSRPENGPLVGCRRQP